MDKRIREYQPATLAVPASDLNTQLATLARVYGAVAGASGMSFCDEFTRSFQELNSGPAPLYGSQWRVASLTGDTKGRVGYLDATPGVDARGEFGSFWFASTNGAAGVHGGVLDLDANKWQLEHDFTLFMRASIHDRAWLGATPGTAWRFGLEGTASSPGFAAASGANWYWRSTVGTYTATSIPIRNHVLYDFLIDRRGPVISYYINRTLVATESTFGYLTALPRLALTTASAAITAEAPIVSVDTFKLIGSRY